MVSLWGVSRRVMFHFISFFPQRRGRSHESKSSQANHRCGNIGSHPVPLSSTVPTPMRTALRRLEVIHDATAPEDTATKERTARLATLDSERREKLQKLSPYHRVQFQCLEVVGTLRNALRLCAETTQSLRDEGCAVDTASGSVTASTNHEQLLHRELLHHRHAARRAHQRLLDLQHEADRHAREAAAAVSALPAPSPTSPRTMAARYEGAPYDVEYRQLSEHIDNARQWYRREFQLTVVSSSNDSFLPPHGPSVGGPSLWPAAASCPPPQRGQPASDAPSPSPAVDAKPSVRYAREEAAYQQFFQEVKEKDDLVDDALDRIADGLHRLRDNAMGIQNELHVQAALLGETRVQLDDNQAGLRQLNRRVYRAIRETETSEMCSYVLCFLCLMLVLSVLVKMTS